MATRSSSQEDDGYSSINGATLEKAQAELKEDPATRGQLVRDLRDMVQAKQREINSEPSHADRQLTFTRTDRIFLLRFLRARKFDLERAFSLYINYHRYWVKYSHLLDNFTPKAVKEIIDSGLFGVLPARFHNGTFVFCVIPSRWDYRHAHPHNPYKTFVLALEKLLDNEEVQVHGLAFLDNMEHSSFQLGIAFMKNESVYRGALVDLQDSYPVRFRGFHMLHQPWYISFIMRMVRPFLKQKHRERIKTYGGDFTMIRELIDPAHLPSNFGGDAPELGPENLRNFFELVSEEDAESDGLSP